MMRLPPFTLRAPRTIDDAVAWLGDAPGETMILAGGTDLVPNMKRRTQTPRTLVSLAHLPALREIRAVDGGWTIGAGATLTAIERDAHLREACAGLHQAVAQIATPHLRNMGTMGGNICLDTRCTYYDQNLEWRKAIGYCMKKDGATCWVAPSSPRCLAVSSTDSAPMLIALGARVTLVSRAGGPRDLALADLYNNDGMAYLTRRADELLTEIRVPDQRGWRSTYIKLRRRGSFDFPVAAVALAIRTDGDRADAPVIDARLVLGAVASRPLVADAACDLLIGHPMTDERLAAAADAAYQLAKPMDNTDFELVWRKRMVKSLVVSAGRGVRS